MKANREGGEDGLAVGRRIAVECFTEMFEAGGGGDAVAREQRHLRRALGQALKGGHARSAVGVPVLPLGVAVEVDAIVQVRA